MSRLFGAFFFVACVVASCSEPEQTDVRPLKASSKKKTTDDEAPAATTVPPPEVAPPVVAFDAGPSATTYVGTLDTTPTVRFGGSPYCFYEVALKDVRIEVAALPSGEIIGASATHTMVENSIEGCTLSGAPPTPCSFAFTTATQTADGYQLDFNGAAGNHPATKLVVNLKKVGSSYEASASWHRTDQNPPLDWTETTKITLGPR